VFKKSYETVISIQNSSKLKHWRCLNGAAGAQCARKIVSVQDGAWKYFEKMTVYERSRLSMIWVRRLLNLQESHKPSCPAGFFWHFSHFSCVSFSPKKLLSLSIERMSLLMHLTD